MFCIHCGSQVPEGAQVCPSCGAYVQPVARPKKYCKYCGSMIDQACVVCPRCGRQVEELRSMPQQPIVINNVSQTAAPYVYPGKRVDKWVSFLLCFFLGYLGAHKFYEGRAGLGILYILTAGLFGIGWFVDTIVILCKPSPYYYI